MASSISDIEKGSIAPTAVEQPERPIPPHINPLAHYTGYEAARPSRLANPGPLGLFSFASTTFMLSMYNVHTRGITTGNVIVGAALWCGGLLQVLAGVFELPRGNVFGSVAFASFGSFWLGYATILIPNSGVIAAFKTHEELENALGIYLIGWFIFACLLFLVALRKHIAHCFLFGFLVITLGCLASSKFMDSDKINVVGGIFGIMTALTAWYIGMSEILDAEEHPLFRLPLGVFAYKK